MSDKQRKSPLAQAWNIFSAIGGAIGTAGIIDDLKHWSGFIQNIISNYSSIVHPIIAPLTDLLGFPAWFNDYVFVGIMVASARVRSIYNNMHGQWLFDTSKYKWYSFWAPNRVAAYFLSIIMVVFWPLVLISFLPPKILGVEEKARDFQNNVWKDQFQWLLVYSLIFISLFIANESLKLIAPDIS
ncbi:hypothetical protein [Pseudomonas sp. N040]|uniref:hypothetical protein n=1 Tax=Pseudomonas sp. N040 TaxID=2785325 RepID=UPI0018A2E764|nr:hypothetical protein [Pseudomonas sp. N040]MBF7728751.1 hypothetical protein [Pseudomonas sp. N040]MBW7012391.1 hypothetical protein [Pseudomonas sp. N040]